MGKGRLMDRQQLQKIQLHLQAPLIALERIAKGRHLPQVFAEAGLEELEKVRELVDRFAREPDGRGPRGRCRREDRNV